MNIHRVYSYLNTMFATSKKAGFTLVELLIVTALIALLIVPAFINYLGAIRNQQLLTAGEQLAEQVRLAHVSSREFRDEKMWGIQTTSPFTTYSLVSSEEGITKIEKTYPLSSSLSFETTNTVNVWFTPSKGELDTAQQVLTIRSSYGKRISVTIFHSGLVEVGPVQ